MKVYGKSWISMYDSEYRKYLRKIKINNYLVKFTQIGIYKLLIACYTLQHIEEIKNLIAICDNEVLLQ